MLSSAVELPGCVKIPVHTDEQPMSIKHIMSWAMLPLSHLSSVYPTWLVGCWSPWEMLITKP